ncbi:MAG TPA: aspartate--tRNA ligase, partial [Gemmatimonadaceae bacterium]|nr:aspartate--tRNA ligase [Gemmatimonadaceae bacterium]
MRTRLRTHLAGELRPQDAGQAVRLAGWVHRVRNLGGLVFLDLRDRAGVVQVSFDPQRTPAAVLDLAAGLGVETVVQVEGEVAARPAEMINPELATGAVEVRATGVRVLGEADTPAIPVARGRGENLPAEELRLRHRYLDLRRPELQANLMLRHRLAQVTRRYLSDAGFLELETPILTKPTPEGARDFLVPSRVQRGEFYALPQSPQLYKQLFMISGFDRYFQIARCFRDEDLRADRQPEFTQIDIEASFIEPEDIYALTEGLLAAIWRERGIDVPAPFPRMTYRAAMERYGTDRPDLRYGLEIEDVSDVFRGIGFKLADEALATGGRVRGFRVPGGATLSRKQLDELAELARSAGGGPLLRVKHQGGALSESLAKALPADGAERLRLADGELGLYVAGPDQATNPALDRLRQEVARRLELVPANGLEFLWVTDFPLFERDPATGLLSAVHHPFTAPNPADVGALADAPHQVRALAYDVVLNGTELGGGSIRIHDSALQGKI